VLKTAASEAIITKGGTISHQHGVGRDHAPYLVEEKGRLGIEALTSIGSVFDPDELLNPGKLVFKPAPDEDRSPAPTDIL
jgi:alkyldihydroxyacetonephosphate synthase